MDEIKFGKEGRIIEGADVLMRSVAEKKDVTARVSFGHDKPWTPPGGEAWRRTGKPAYLVSADETTPTNYLPLFELSKEIWDASLTGDDRAQMLNDMQAAGVLHLPFGEIAIRFCMDDPPDWRSKGGAGYITFVVSDAISLRMRPSQELTANAPIMTMVGVETASGQIQLFDLKPHWDHDGDIQANDDSNEARVVSGCQEALTVLLMALATRNVVTKTENNTRIKRANKQSKPEFRGPLGTIYISRTVVELPKDMETDPTPKPPGYTGRHPRPHMRRGHQHTVLYGTKRREREVRWFPAVYVNGFDPSERVRKYVVK
jgi:hypothetical protein